MAGSEKQLWCEDSCRDTWAEPSALGSGPLGIPKEKSPGALLDVGLNPGPASCQHKPHICRITVLRDTGPQRHLHGKARGQKRQESQHMTSSSWMSPHTRIPQERSVLCLSLCFPLDLPQGPLCAYFQPTPHGITGKQHPLPTPGRPQGSRCPLFPL